MALKLQITHANQLDALHFLHDAEVQEIRFYYDEPEDERVFEVRCTTGIENEPPELDNLPLTIKFVRNSVVTGTYFGAQCYADQINYLIELLEVPEKIKTSQSSQYRRNLTLCLVFHSGSWLDIACDSVLIEEVS